MEQKKIDRINELARKAKGPEGLTPAETAERDALRQVCGRRPGQPHRPAGQHLRPVPRRHPEEAETEASLMVF